MYKGKINQFHIKYPFVESIFLFVNGILIGIFSSLFTGEILAADDEHWRFVDSLHIWIVVFLMVVGIVYYWKFSSYSIGKQISSAKIAADTIIDTLANETKKMLESDAPITFEKRLTLVKKTTQVIYEVDAKLSGGVSNEK